jgi:hypothetical protein
MCDELLQCAQCAALGCGFCDGRCYIRIISSASNGSSGDALLLERCFDGTSPILAIAECPATTTTLFTSNIETTTTATTVLTTATSTITTVLMSIATTTSSSSSDSAIDSSALTIGLLAAFLLLCCLVSSLLLACYCLRSVAASRANDANDADVSLFDDYEEEEAARLDLASRLVPLDASRTASVESATSVAQSPPRDDNDNDDDNDDNEIIDASTLHDTMADLAPRVSQPPGVLDGLMADLADVSQLDGPHVDEFAWQPDAAAADAISRRISATAGARPFVKRASARASVSKRASDRAILRASVSKKSSERDISMKRSARRRASTQFADLAADEEASPAVPDVGDSDSDEGAAASVDELPQTPPGVKPGNVFLCATEATHLANSGAAVSSVAGVVQRAVQSAQAAEKAALGADDAASAAAIRAQMVASSQATKKYAASPSQATASALRDVLARLIAVTVAYDRPAASRHYADELDSDDAIVAKTQSKYADELNADSSSTSV